jgi:hypothetical protein
MESSELFLLAWAMLATVLAIYYHHKTNRLKFTLFVQQMGFRMIGEGKAKVVIDGDNVKVIEA